MGTLAKSSKCLYWCFPVIFPGNFGKFSVFFKRCYCNSKLEELPGGENMKNKKLDKYWAINYLLNRKEGRERVKTSAIAFF